jgi:hypothetical protein
MFIIGLLSFFQVVFIPGYILIKYIDLGWGIDNAGVPKLRQLVYGFGFSLLINYLLVFYLTLTGLYTAIGFYIVLAIEAILLIYHWLFRGGQDREHWNKTLTINFNHIISRIKDYLGSHSFTHNLLMLMAIAVLFIHIFYFFYFLVTVFMHWDPVVSWNRFALDWAGNRIPSQTWRYPQLVPANWSISYVLMGSSQVQAFAKSIMPLFSIGIMLLFADLGLRKKSAVYWLGLIVYGVLLGYLYNPSLIVSGYVDIAVSFFAFLSFHVMFSRYHKEETGNPRRYFGHIFLAVIFASASAITKQAGLFILMFILVWVFGSLYRHREPIPIKKILAAVLLLIFIVLVVTASWYILKEIQIGSGLDRSEVTMVQNVHKVDGYLERFGQGVQRILNYRPAKLKVIPTAIMFLVFLSLFHRRSWWVTLFIVLPFILLWGFFFSYDSRNLSFVLPFIAFSTAFGAALIKKGVSNSKNWPTIRLPLIPLLLFLLALLIVFNFTIFKKDRIIQHQERQMLSMGEVELNKRLTNYCTNPGLKGKIATNYLYLKYLPRLKDYFIYKGGRITMTYLDYLETDAGEEIRYLLMPLILKSEKEIMLRFRNEIESGRYRMIFKNRGYWFVDVRND